MSVGRIVQVHPLDVPFQRGEEKSVFRFGGSAIVVFGEPGRGARMIAFGTANWRNTWPIVARRPKSFSGKSVV